MWCTCYVITIPLKNSIGFSTNKCLLAGINAAVIDMKVIQMTHRSEEQDLMLIICPGTPDWYRTDGPPSSNMEVAGSRPVSRLQTAEAEGYMERNKHGTTSDW